MLQRGPETRLCPFVADRVCMAAKCMMYHAEPNSTVAYCQISELGGMARNLSMVQLAINALGLKLDGIANALKK